ncbi:hypothetical protein SSX86_028995 [Deinandra increscens subsp. villosa]|uniref:Uncharacterized protein n=1 Tax=Deinandra increscens subsp. villosa TaxID=3103831 RepID=A0AAP0GK59_9ASTR
METTAGGREMVALCPLKGGEIVLRDSPILHYSAIHFHSDNHPDSHGYCSNCFTTIAQQSQDVSCLTCGCRFCTLDCQSTASATSHTPWACQALTASSLPSSKRF